MWGVSSFAGEVVSPQIALQLSAVWACCKILAEVVGMLPLDMYECAGDTVKPAPNHPLQTLLHDEPNPEMTAIEYRMSQMASLALWGNCYSKKAVNGRGDVIALWPIQPQTINNRRNAAGRIEYYHTPVDGSPETLPADQVFHPRAMSLDGLTGLSPVTQLRNAMGLALALERYGSRYFANGAIPGIVLEYPGEVTDEMERNIRESWLKIHGGADNANGVAIIEEGMKVTVLGVDPQKSQSIESRKFQILEVARAYRMQPHLLADLDRATFSNIEQLSLEFVIYTLMPWLVIWEQAINRSLLQDRDKGRYFAAFNVDRILRGDLKSRYEAYAIGRQGGWLSVNDILRLENMNTIGPEGDTRLSPLNMVSVGPGAPAPGTPGPGLNPAVPPGKQITEIRRYLNGHAGDAIQ